MLDLLNLPDKIKLEVSKSNLIAFADYLLNHQSKAIEFDDEFISISEVMQLTGKAKQTIYGRVSNNTIPYYKAEGSRKLRFKKSEIIEWMNGKKLSDEASRRTYLKKVVLAPFEGITSNTTFVIKANENYIDKRLLPFLMLSEGFTEHSIKNSKGSVNPYINWKDLANYEFLLPPQRPTSSNRSTPLGVG